MKASELISILAKYPDAEVNVAWEEYVQYSELTSGTEDRIEGVNAVYIKDGELLISSNCYLIGEKVWP